MLLFLNLGRSRWKNLWTFGIFKVINKPIVVKELARNSSCTKRQASSTDGVS